MIQTNQTFKLEDYITQYRSTNDLKVRNIIAKQYIYLVKIIASKSYQVNQTVYDKDDIINEGMIGLMDAIEKFDFNSNVKFETYASIRIKGAIIDFMRKQDRVPRKLKKTYKEIQEAERFLTEKNGQAVKKQDVLSHLKITDKEYTQAKQVENYNNSISLDSLEWEDGIDFSLQSSKQNEGESFIANKELMEKLTASIDQLTDREKMIISLYYVDEIKLSDIGELLNISQSRVCQIHSQVLKKLKLKLVNYV